MPTTRRQILAAGAMLGLSGLTGARLSAASLPGERNFLMVLLRGAADGMALAAPIGDPGFAQLRGPWRDGYADAPKLDGMFALHPALKRVAQMYAAGDALVAHAVATSYRERSHFDAQNLLETGGAAPFARSDGALNRLIGLIGGDPRAIAVAPSLPLMLRGPRPAASYAPSTLPAATAELLERLPGLYQDDAQLGQMWSAAARTHANLSGESDDRKGAADLGTLAARMMTGRENARLVMVDLPGWDSHAGQEGQLQRSFAQLDLLLGAFRDGIGGEWDRTLVAVATEFGRTAAINGTRGTDHGTGGAALLLGGAIKGGRVLADWPGLRAGDLYQDRDLRPTQSLEALLSGALAEHFRLDPARALATLFPGRTQRAVSGLIA